MNQPSDEPGKKPRKLLSLDDLTPAKVEAPTSIGQLWLRHPGMTELARFCDIKDDAQRGREAIVVLANRNHEKRDQTPLAAEDFGRLAASDVEALAVAISANCKWESPRPATLEGLGRSALEASTKHLEEWSQASKDLYQNIAGSYSFLKDESLATLQRQIDEVTRASSALGSTGLLPKHEELLRTIGAEARKPFEDQRAAYLQSISGLSKPLQVEAPEHFKLPTESLRLPAFEDSPMGKATLESLRLDRTTAAHTAQMASAVSNLQQTFVSVVFPQWSKSLQESQAGAEQTFRQAARSLFWTKWALVASVLVSLGIAVFQFNESRFAGIDSAAQAEKSDAILRQQLELQRHALEQQTKDAAAVRESIEALRGALAVQTVRSSGSAPVR